MTSASEHSAVLSDTLNENHFWPDRIASGSLTGMVSLPKPEVILTHESDLDGLVSGILLQRLARKLFNADVRLEAYNYHNWRQRELREKAAWVADLTFEPRMDRANWVIIDHHAVETPPKNAVFIHNLNKSAGLICYELCQQEGDRKSVV